MLLAEPRGDLLVVVEGARRRRPIIVSAIMIHGLLWQKMPAFSL